MPTNDDRRRLVQAIQAKHREDWNDERAAEMRRFRDVYMVDYWGRRSGRGATAAVNGQATGHIETADGHVMVESYIASLFASAPGVEVGPAPDGKGNPELAQAVINAWLRKQANLVQQAARLGLIYDYSAAKLAPCPDAVEPLDRIEVRAVPPWEVVTDSDADRWEDQRYIGHVYFLPVAEARANKRWPSEGYKPRPRKHFLDKRAINSRDRTATTQDLPERYLFVEVWEVYDLVLDELIFYTDDHPEKILQVLKPRKLGAEEVDADADNDAAVKVGGVPVRTAGDQPLPPLAPLYFSSVPDQPLHGMSAIGRVYDQLAEKNIYRTFMAQSTRRDARVYVTREGAFDEKELAKATSGIDGVVAKVSNTYSGPLNDALQLLDTGKLSTNIDAYLRLVEGDLQRGQITASFTRGDATKATATEVTALAQYTQSEIGRLAERRDAFLASVAHVFLRMLVLMLEEGDKLEVLVGKEVRSVSPDDLDADFNIVPLDQAATPISSTLRREQLVRLVELLGQLGVPQRAMLEEVVRQFDLPDSFLKAPPTPAPGVAPAAMPGAQPPVDEALAINPDAAAPEVGGAPME